MDNATSLGWEQALLGTALADPTVMEEAEDLLPSDLTGNHQTLWAEMLTLHRRGALDSRTLVEMLRTREVLDSIGGFGAERDAFGEDYLAALLTHRGANMREYADQVIDASLKRQLLRVSALIRADAEDQRVSAREAHDNAEQRVIALRRSRSNELGTPLAEILTVFSSRVEGMVAGTLQPYWEPPILAIRNLLKYVDKDDFLLYAARPGEGKSSMLRFDFGQTAMAGRPVLLFNLENGEVEYAKFMVAMVTGIDSEKLKDPRLLSPEELERVRSAIQTLRTLPLYVKTMGAPSALEIERIARLHVVRYNVELIGVDYVQLVRNGKENKVQDVSESSGILRGVALRYGVPVLAACQMSRNIVHRGAEAEPELSDLRESGSLEQDATIVEFPRAIWQNPTAAQLRTFPENINPETNELYRAVKAIPIRVYVKKNRNGAQGLTHAIKWIKSTNTYQTLTGDFA